MRELDLLNHIYANTGLLPARVTIAPGDDMGAVTIGAANVLVTVDQVADGVHFRLSETPLAKAARKAVTRNLSDVAAMGALPCAAVVAAALPRGFGETQATALFDAMRAVALVYDCPLIGGDISIWDHPLHLSVTVIAEAAGVEPVSRRGARPGDIICVTGMLGGSQVPVTDPPGYVHHLDFEPRLAVGRKLAGEPALRPRCMLDLSDGLGKDLPRLCALGEGGPVSAELWVDRLPLSRAASLAAEHDGHPPWQHALGDGEDYELCFIIDPQTASRLPSVIEGVPVTQIGQITAPADVPVMLKKPDGSREPMADVGWEHRG